MWLLPQSSSLLRTSLPGCCWFLENLMQGQTLSPLTFLVSHFLTYNNLILTDTLGIILQGPAQKSFLQGMPSLTSGLCL